MRSVTHLLTRSILILVMLIFTGCKVELYHGLHERQANEILLLLLEAGLEAEKKPDNNDPEKWMVTVNDTQADYALSLLIANELPRTRSMGFDDIYNSSGLLPSEAQETARYMSALAGELQETLEADDSVLRARVHLHYREENRFKRSQTPDKATASVYLKIDPESGSQCELSDDEVKSLVANSLAQLIPQNVVVIRSKSVRTISSSQFSTTELKTNEGKIPLLFNRKPIVLITAFLLMSGGLFSLVMNRKRRESRNGRSITEKTHESAA